MLVAFISDVHGNLPALEAAVNDARERGATDIYCAGDITGYGPFPDEVCNYLHENSINAIMGNYDLKVVTVMGEGASAASDLQKKKRKVLLWTASHIHQRTQRYLQGLPQQLALELPGAGKVLVVHGTPIDIEDYIYPSITDRGLKAKIGKTQVDVLVCGHSHIPFVKRVSGVLVVNCGSVGQPVDGDPRLAYAIVNASADSAPRARIIRADYDWKRTMAALKETSLPKALRQDLARGTKRALPK